jgi:hypothetical protein
MKAVAFIIRMRVEANIKPKAPLGPGLLKVGATTSEYGPYQEEITQLVAHEPATHLAIQNP